jgi:hypothetical protein
MKMNRVARPAASVKGSEWVVSQTAIGKAADEDREPIETRRVQKTIAAKTIKQIRQAAGDKTA